MHSKHRLNRTRGFSVIEVLIAVLILGVGLAGMAQLHKSNIDGAIYAKQSSIAADFAQQKIAELAPSLNATATTGDNVTDPVTGISFTRTWTVAEGSDGTTRVSVNVKWPGESTGITAATVSQNYTPDQAYRTLKVIPVVAAPAKVSTSFISASSSSCTSYEMSTMMTKSCSSTTSMMKQEDDD